jgi:hypothetical protein
MTTITQSIPSLGTPPLTTDPVNFDARADTLYGTSLPAVITAINTWAGQTNTVAGEINTAVDDAEQAVLAAEAAANATLWVSGSFAEGAVRYSPTDFQTYRKVGALGGTTDPALDFVNWTKISSGGAARIFSTASDTSPLAWNSDLYDTTIITAQAEALTISADAGVAQFDGKRHLFRFKDNGVARALTFTTGSSKSFRAVGRVIPTTTVISKELYIGVVWNAGADRWDVISVAREV